MMNNRDNRPLRVCHADLEKFTNDSPFKVCCPVCKEGMMPVRREGGRLLNVDHCVACGQVFVYSDDYIAGEKLMIASPQALQEKLSPLSVTISTSGNYLIQVDNEPPVARYLEAGDVITRADALPARKVEE